MNVTARATGQSDGTIKRQFIDCVDTDVKAYTYETAQDSLTVRNKGNQDIVVNVNSTNYTMQPLQSWTCEVGFTLFTVQSVSGLCEIEVTSFEYGNKPVYKHQLDVVTSQLAELTNIAPKNFIKNKGLQLTDFSNLSLFQSVTGTLTPDTEHFITGKQGGKLIVTAAGSYAKGDIAIRIPASKLKSLSVRFYVPDISTFYAILVYLSNDAGFTRIFSANRNNVNDIVQGWNNVKFDVSNFATSSGALWTDPIIAMRVRINAMPGVVTTGTIDEIRINEVSIPMLVWTFDGQWDGAYNIAMPMLAKRSMKGSMYVTTNMVGGTKKMTWTQLDDMYFNYGWDMCNHTRSHNDLTTITDAELISQVKDCENVLYARGYTRGVKHIAYPFGYYNQHVMDMCQSLGLLTGRTIKQFRQEVPILKPFELSNYLQMTNTTTFATCQTKLDTTIANGGTMFAFLHSVADTPTEAEEAQTAVLQQFVDYAYDKIVNGELYCLPISEYWDIHQGLKVPVGGSW